MKKIFKYRVDLSEGDRSELVLPAGSKIISVAVQREAIVIYAIVDPDIMEKMIVSVYIVGTGHKIPFDINEYTFLGTISLLDGKIMFHIFYKLEG